MNWEQLRAILWLRWRLSWNQISRGSPLNLILSIIATTGGYVAALGATVAGFFLGYHNLGPASPETVLRTWDGIAVFFLFMWLVGLLVEIQRSETIDVQRLLHLPISLPQLFVVNYIASHLTMSIIVAGPGMVSLAVGMAARRGPVMIWLVPLVIGFIVFVTAWTYYLRGWLVSLMVNQRRRRSIVVGLTIAIMLVLQLPNIYFNLSRMTRSDRGSRRRQSMMALLATDSPGVQRAHKIIPPLWLPNGAGALASGNPWPALAGAAGLWALGGLGLWRAHRATLRFYQGEPTRGITRPQPSMPIPAPITQGNNSLMVEWRIPGMSEDTAALAWASLRSMLRAPELKMTLLGPGIMLIVFATMYLRPGSTSFPSSAASFVPTGLITLVFFSLLQVLLNQFGLDRHGFRTLVLLPTPRKNLLLGRNIAFAPIVLLPIMVVLALLPGFAPVPILSTGAAFLQLIALYFLISTYGNIISIAAPFRIHAGSLKPTKNPPKIVLLLLLSHLAFPIVSFPIFVPPLIEFFAHRFGWLPGFPLNLALSAMVAVLAFAIYALSLEPLSQWFERREKEILVVVTQEVE